MDIVERLRDWQDYEPVKMFAAEMLADLEEAAVEIERLLNAIKRIDGINDNPAHFNKAINDVCNTILRPELVDNVRR